MAGCGKTRSCSSDAARLRPAVRSSGFRGNCCTFAVIRQRIFRHCWRLWPNAACAWAWWVRPVAASQPLLARLAEQGLPIFSADSEVADLYAAGGDGADMIGRRFGNQYLTSQGAVDKPALFQAMRDSGQVLREVMDLVHPMVRHRAEVFFSNHAGEIAVAEVPLLLEGGWREAGMVDCVAGVFCPDELRRGAYRTSRGLDQDTLAVFDSWQWPADRKRPMCDFVVENDAGLDKLDAAAQALIRDLEALRAKRVAARLAEAHAAVDRAVSELENEEQ